jgi:spore coat protein CotF
MDGYSSITNPADRDRIMDLLSDEKHLTDTYNTFSIETSGRGLHQDLLSILNDEHELEFRLFEEMNRRGWYSVEYAEQRDIDSVKDSYSRMS